MIEPTPHEAELRQRAILRLKKRRDFYAHALVYLMVNSFLVVIWWLTTPWAFFWPMIPLAGWAIGLVMNAWDVFVAKDFGEAQIQREMEHLRGR